MPASISIAASAVFTYYLIKLLVKPYIDVKLAAKRYREFATNAVTAVDIFTDQGSQHFKENA